MLDISFKSNVDAISRNLSALAYRQLPYAESRTVTELAKLAAKAEKTAIPQVFPDATPFTVNSVAVQPARKALPVARVYVCDVAAQYLAPYEYGGVQFLGAKPADLVPVNVAANRYGNLPRNTIRQYLNRPDVFLGTVKTKHGEQYGLWQRPAKVVEVKWSRRNGPKPKDRAINASGKLKLLVAFHTPVETRKRLGFGERAHTVATANFDRVFGAQLAKAIATAREA
ncbi:hypothetical protein [Paraburkholderia adhaesiva]|uniref:hypothetical protein n=1 Tax=Paraburkholderia adhaesiva TaxID=2883244 RepID=UPI001F43AC22|nr:hypothetical protein [Paraburkholderia adhaesiva]